MQRPVCASSSVAWRGGRRWWGLVCRGRTTNNRARTLQFPTPSAMTTWDGPPESLCFRVPGFPSFKQVLGTYHAEYTCITVLEVSHEEL